MSFGIAIDIAIGLVLMYLVLSLVCTVINEYLSQILGLRAKTLAAGIGRLIDDPRLHKDFYDHGLVDMTKAASGGAHPSYLSGQTFAMALIGSLDPTKALPGFKDVEEAVQSLPDSNVRDTLLSHLAAAQGDLGRLRDGLASTFDAAMDRLSGIYKRKLRWFSLLVGLAVAVVLNADTFVVTRALWNDGALRAAMVAEAPLVLKKAAEARSNVAPEGAMPKAEQKVAKSSPNADVSQSWVALRPLPLGWGASSFHWQKSGLANLIEIVAKLLGLVLTGLALSLGAPFWFDLLSKFVQLRATGEKPAASATSAGERG